MSRSPVSARLYLDHAATTPVLPQAQTAMRQGLELWANPSSPHAPGRTARAALEEARERIKALFAWDGHVIFTSGASEAIAIGLGRANVVKIITSPVEHDAVLRVTRQAERLPIGSDGLIGSLPEGNEPYLFAIQHVNNETGVIQPLAEISRTIGAWGGVLFADCAQSAGRLPLPEADMIAISAHKFGGPPGVGALLVRDLGLLQASGGQEQGYRPGTENLPGILGMAAALEAQSDWFAQASDLRRFLDETIEASGGVVVAKDSPRMPTIGSYRMPDVAASAQLIQFDMAGISVSAGSACSSGTIKASHVLTALGWDGKAAGEVVRVSFGSGTSKADIERFLAVWTGIFDRARR
ncbi:cysteine desulfurase family protein [Rhizorhapis suberifaciens]|uniref:cysteine desulfurase family protein n=1 Tax=Rhizorhapis suberifaciens TaxID=13656 RepID=UPI00161A766D|nr:cysteine desulfurase family protein [Rhizorhapis suberifaciens]